MYGSSLLSVTSEAGFPVVSIDPPSGVVQHLFNTNVATADFGYGTFDPSSRQLYFLSGSVGSQQLVTADLNSMTATSRSIAMAAAYLFFEWDPAGRKILALTSQPGTPLVSIDPATGAVQHLFDTNAASVSFGFSAFDPSSRQLYFLSGSVGSQQLVTADLNSMTVTSRSIAMAAAYIFFEWDPAGRKILALTSQPGTPLVSIDPLTGVIQNLFNTNTSAVSFGLSAFDPLSRQLYFLSGTAGSQQLVTADLGSMTVTSKSIAMPAFYLFFEWNVTATSIPTLQEWSLLMLIVSLAAAGVFVLRTRIA
jgi:Tol biopolymer transport system component